MQRSFVGITYEYRRRLPATRRSATTFSRLFISSVGCDLVTDHGGVRVGTSSCLSVSLDVDSPRRRTLPHLYVLLRNPWWALRLEY
jgi:hypothetical protein